jgi:hypothetical protein
MSSRERDEKTPPDLSRYEERTAAPRASHGPPDLTQPLVMLMLVVDLDTEVATASADTSSSSSSETGTRSGSDSASVRSRRGRARRLEHPPPDTLVPQLAETREAYVTLAAWAC